MPKLLSPDTPPPNTCRLLLLLSVLLFLAYSNSFTAGWQLDDPPNILNNHKVHITEFTSKQFWDAMTAQPGYPYAVDLHRPVARLSLGMNWFFGQDDITGYHVVNFSIHLFNSFFLFFLIQQLFKTPRLQNLYSPGQVSFIAITATLLWALNPIQTQAVTYIVQRMTSLAALFSILSLLFYIKMRLCQPGVKRALFCTVTILSYLLAFFSKQNAIMIILAVPFLEFFFFNITVSRKNLKSAIILFLGASIFCIGIAFLTKPDLLNLIFDLYNKRPFTMLERVLTEQRILVFYLSQIFFPHPGRLSVQHDIILSTSLFSPVSTVFAILLNIGLVTLALLTYKRQPLLSFAIIFFYINHLVESTFIPLELLFEHRNYLPSIFLFVPVAQFIVYLTRNAPHSRGLLLTLSVILTLTFTTLAYATFSRNQDWQTIITLWTDAAEKAPNSARPISSLSYELGWGEDQSLAALHKSLELHKESLKMDMNRTDLHSKILGNMALLYFKLNKYEEGIRTYQKALSYNERDNRLRYNYTRHLIWLGELDEAEQQIKIILESGFNHPDIWNLFAFIDIWKEQPTRALSSLLRAIRKSPERYDINLHLGKCLSQLEHHERARLFLTRAREFVKEEEDALFLDLLWIENYLLNDEIDAARAKLQEILTRYPINKVVAPVTENYADRYKHIRLEDDILRPFIQSEISSDGYFFPPPE